MPPVEESLVDRAAKGALAARMARLAAERRRLMQVRHQLLEERRELIEQRRRILEDAQATREALGPHPVAGAGVEAALMAAWTQLVAGAEQRADHDAGRER